MKKILIAAAITFMFAGCSQEPPQSLDKPAAPASPTSPTEPADVVESPPAAGADVVEDDAAYGFAVPDGAIWVDPLSNCEGNQVTTVHWNEDAVANGAIRIWIEGPTPGLFAQAGAAGSKETGRWAAPGMTFRITDVNDRELAKVVVSANVQCD